MEERRKKSKKRYAASSARQPDPPIFFIDRALGEKVVPGMLIDAGFKVEILTHHFPADSEDTVWLTEVGKRGWVVLSKDKNIRKRMLERKALLDAKVAAFILTSGNLTGEEMGQIFIKAHNRMVRFLKKNSRPFIAAVTRDGKVTKLVG